MKKNKMMRLASGLLVAVLLTTSMISGTFAKYVTSASGGDSARVARWGIQMNTDGTGTFSNTYEAKVGNGSDDISVNSYVGDVVAPGTNGSSSYVVTGAPETDYELSFNYNGSTFKEVYLGPGTYNYPAQYASSMDVTLADGNYYYPMTYTVTITAPKGEIKGALAGGTDTYNTLAAAFTALQGTTIYYEAQESCDAQISIAWNWAYEQSADSYDTVLGDLAEAAVGNPVALDATGAYSLNTEFEFIITATQMD